MEARFLDDPDFLLMNLEPATMVEAAPVMFESRAAGPKLLSSSLLLFWLSHAITAAIAGTC
jgi:hypothetical protein